MNVLLQATSALILLLPAVAANVPEDFGKFDFSIDVDIAMTGEHDEVQNSWHGSTHLFAIDVTPKRGQTPWKVKHRFNDFHTLSSALGSATFQAAPFPSSVAALEFDAGQLVIARRKALQAWLQAVLKHPESQGRWKSALQKFLHPSAKPDKYMKDKVADWLGDLLGMKAVVNAPMPDASTDLSGLDVGISMSGEADDVRGTSHVFAIVVTPAVGEPRTLMRRFNDFYKLKKALGTLSGTIDGAPFPPTHNFFYEKDAFLQERRAALASWLQAVLKHRESKTSWAVPLLEFVGTTGPGIHPGDDAKQTLTDWKAKINEAVIVANKKVSETAASIQETASPFIEKASKTASETATSIKETASPCLEKASQTASETATSIKETASPYLEKASETAASIKEKASPYLEKASQTASETVTSIKETASPYLEKASPYLEKASETAASIKETLVAQAEEAKKYLIVAEEANADFIEAKEKYEAATSAKEKSEAEGAEQSVIQAAAEQVEALKANMVELGERAAEGMVKAKDAMEDVEEISLEALEGEAPLSGAEAPTEEL